MDGPSPVLSRIHQFLREPLLHFAILGAGLFSAGWWFSEPQVDTIVVDSATVSRIVDSRQQELDRELTEEERQALIDRYVDNQILLREFFRQGLYRAPQVTRQLSQEIRHVMVGDVERPTDEQLKQFAAEHPDRYVDPTADFDLIKPELIRDWEAAQREARVEEKLQQLRGHYEVIVQRGESP